MNNNPNYNRRPDPRAARNVSMGQDASRPPVSQEEMIRRERMKRERAKREMMRRRRAADVRALMIVAVIFGLIAVCNLFQFNRPTESEVEKRKLAEFPRLTFSSLTSGDFTEGVNFFFADTFLFRDGVVALSKKLDSLKGYQLDLGDGGFEVLDPGVSKDENDSSVGDILDSLGDDTEADTTAPPAEPAPDSGITLNKSSITLTVGGGAVLTAELDDDVTGELIWSVDNTDAVELTYEGDSAKLKAKASGEAVVTCSADGVSVKCNVKVETIAFGGVDNGDTADFMTNGLFIYGDAVYTQPWYLENYASEYGDTLAYYKKLFPDARVSACVIPTSAIRIDNDEINEKFPDQAEIFTRLDELIGTKVNFVNTYAEMYNNRDEYIYFKSDHHWTQRGAYYAYKAFVESVGLEAATHDDFDIKVLTESYSGSMYEYTKSEKVKSFKDTVEAFMSKKELTMTVTDRSGQVTVYDKAILESSKSYSAFLAGDNPYTVINVPENPQDRNILVIKDSYGNAFVPFLVENYGNIMVVDTRYTTMNVKETFADYDLTDILFINNLEAANSPAWAKMYLRAVGVAVD